MTRCSRCHQPLGAHILESGHWFCPDRLGSGAVFLKDEAQIGGELCDALLAALWRVVDGRPFTDSETRQINEALFSRRAHHRAYARSRGDDASFVEHLVRLLEDTEED